MDKAQFSGMKALAAQLFVHIAGTVYAIPCQRMADGGHMHPNLMGAAGLELTGNTGEVSKPFQYLPARISILSMGALRQHGHLFAVFGVTAKKALHKACILPQIAVHHRLIDPVDTVNAHLFGKALMGGVIFCHHQQAAGILVDSVNDAGTDGAANAGQTTAAMVQQRVHQRPVRITRSRMDHHPLGLVHHQQVLVLIDDFQGDFLGLRLNGLGVRQQDRHSLSGAQLFFLVGGVAVTQHAPLLRQSLHRAAGKLTAGRSRPDVQTLSGSRLRYDQVKLSHPSQPFHGGHPAGC